MFNEEKKMNLSELGMLIVAYLKTLISTTGAKCLSYVHDYSLTAVTLAKRPTFEQERTASKTLTATNHGI